MINSSQDSIFISYFNFNQNKKSVMNSFLALMFIFVFTVFSENNYASSSQCIALFSSEILTNKKLELSSELFSQKQELLNLKSEYKFTNRGFITNKIPVSAELMHELRTEGFMWYGMRYFVSEKLSTALEHAFKESDIHQGGVYFIKGSKSLNIEALTKVKGSEAFDKLVDEAVAIDVEALDSAYVELPSDHYQATQILVSLGIRINPSKENPLSHFVQKQINNEIKNINVWPLSENQREVIQQQNSYSQYNFGFSRIIKITPVANDLIKKRIDSKLVNWSFSDQAQGPFLDTQGWCILKKRGVIVFAEKDYSGLYRKSRKYLRNEGLSVKFNTAFKESLDFVSDQKRRVAGQYVSNSRYMNQNLYQAMLDSHKLGKSFSVEVWYTNPETKKEILVGGILVSKTDNLYSPETVFYSDEVKKHITADLARIAFLALKDRLEEVGIDFVETGRRSAFTASVGGKIIDEKEYEQKLIGLKSKQFREPNFTGKWEPLGL